MIAAVLIYVAASLGAATVMFAATRKFTALRVAVAALLGGVADALVTVHLFSAQLPGPVPAVFYPHPVHQLGCFAWPGHWDHGLVGVAFMLPLLAVVALRTWAGPMDRRTLIVGGGAILLAGYVYGGNSSAATSNEAFSNSHAVAKIIAYAKAQHGKPYLLGGTGPGSFDCSGLVMEAYRSAGIDLPRTSQEQWTAGPRVHTPQPGDLVFFPGGDGTWSQPGHVGLVTGKHTMIQAYGITMPIGTYPFGIDAALSGTGPGTVIGYTRPWVSH